MSELATAQQALAPAAAVTKLNRVMAAAGWEVSFVDMDLTGARPTADIRLMRDDGRWVHARADALGRCTLERFKRERYLGMSRNTKGRRPQSPQVEDVFLGRQHFEGPRVMLRHLTSYVADNALHPVLLADVRAAWAAVMAAPLRLTHEQPT